MHLIVYDLASSNADFVFLLGDVGDFFFFFLGLIIEFETLENMKLLVLYDFREWVFGSGAGIGAN